MDTYMHACIHTYKQYINAYIHTYNTYKHRALQCLAKSLQKPRCSVFLGHSEMNVVGFANLLTESFQDRMALMALEANSVAQRCFVLDSTRPQPGFSRR